MEPPGTPVPADDPEASDTGRSLASPSSSGLSVRLEPLPKLSNVLSAEKPNALAEPRREEETLTKKGKKKKSVRWAEEEQLKEYFYFDLDETERGGQIHMTTTGGKLNMPCT